MTASATMISQPAGTLRVQYRLIHRRIDAEPETIERREMADIDSELRVATKVSGVKVVEINVQQAQGLVSFACSWFSSSEWRMA